MADSEQSQVVTVNREQAEGIAQALLGVGYQARLMVDGGLKVSVDLGEWSLPYGTVES